ncbi:hypothetical protein TI39_contig322g00020 [Zymoseptoria brevis]|uniref:Uncharacterized protein n=1 Tax=Zymoseptoria brevis TaxID=1047168 RepID=A0A0F4GTM4_9PEZI|nr:hypothetical protein TI39_contig322g00020 [Zymoseptoria brevis]
MGIIISKTELSPFSTATGIIGLISFVFTLGTFLKVVWINLEIMGQAPHEVHSYPTNLRTELLEERANMRAMRKQSKKHTRAMRKEQCGERPSGTELDDVSLKTMADTVRHLMKRFRALEQSFLEPGKDGIDGWSKHRSRRDGSVSPYDHAAYTKAPSGRRLTQDRGRRDDEEEDDALRHCEFDLGRRLVWLRRKAEAQQLFETLRVGSRSGVLQGRSVV